MTTGADKDHPHAVRLIFEYEGTDIRLVSRQRVEMIPPPSDRLADQRSAQGIWAEVRDAGHNALYRCVLHDPVRHDVEVFSEDSDRSIARVPVETPRGTFAILVPDIEAADHVALVGSPIGRTPGLAPPAELARFDLRPGPDDAPDAGDGGR
ncbi:hypothetical protein [Streptomyces sp.]|uniref:hypothetical protein n=1 Tax=Streptomyces sp. TaxID=1931 RepID=UPI00281194B0|nr:hypothetical protein [Streptomyces sp.]